MIWKYMKHEDYLDMAYLYATKVSGCCKVTVGSVIVKDDRMIAFGANRAMPNVCKTCGCLRVEKYGNDSKAHRNPDDCRAIHSEICALASLRESAADATIYVTRYPCEACARAIAAAGINTVVYGGTTRISRMTEALFQDFEIRCIWLPDWKEDLSDR